MKRVIIPLVTIIITTGYTCTVAQDTTNVDTSGWQIGFSGEFAGWSSSDVEMGQETGWGVMADYGYRFNENFSLYVPFHIGRFNPSEGGDYNLFNIGLGGEYRFGDYNNKVRPAVNFSYNSIWLYQNIQTGDLNIISNGPGIGGGLLIGLSAGANLRLRYMHYWSNITTVTIGDNEYDADGNLTSGHFSFGIVRYF